MTTANTTLMEYSDQKRLSIYKMLTSACTHLYSKGKLQEDKFIEIAKIFADLAVNDPIFMAHLTAWAHKKDSKDLKVLSIFFNALNDANGTPFFKGSKKCKPNFREVSYALLNELDPHLALRVLKLCHKRFEVKGILNDARHFPTGMKTSFRKYLHYREENVDMLRGIKRNGLGTKMIEMYRLTRTAPTDDAASILNWQQGSIKKGTRREIEMEKLPNFTNKTSDEIVAELKSSKLSAIVAMSIISKDQMDAKIGKALLKNCSGNQAIILYNYFSKNGYLDIPEIKAIFKDKVKEATTAIDRIDTLTKNADVEDKKEMAQVRSDKRKSASKDEKIGKVFMHIDVSGSMNAAIEFAKEKGCVFAECVNDPAKNFNWGTFHTVGRLLAVPKEFTKEDFHAALYGIHTQGQTDCIALYEDARKFGAEIDVYITDQGHNIGTINKRIREMHEKHPEYVKPRAAIIVDYSGNRNASVKNLLESELISSGIPVAIIKPEALNESALVAQSVRMALVGELAIIEEILNTKLPSLPKWWNKISSVAKKEEVVPAV
jgi:hypothetical protein